MRTGSGLHGGTPWMPKTPRAQRSLDSNRSSLARWTQWQLHLHPWNQSYCEQILLLVMTYIYIRLLTNTTIWISIKAYSIQNWSELLDVLLGPTASHQKICDGPADFIVWLRIHIPNKFEKFKNRTQISTPSYQILYPTISKNPRPNVQPHALHDFSWCRRSAEVHKEFLRVGCCSNCLGILRATLAASIAAFPPFWCSGVRRFNRFIWDDTSWIHLDFWSFEGTSHVMVQFSLQKNLRCGGIGNRSKLKGWKGGILSNFQSVLRSFPLLMVAPLTLAGSKEQLSYHWQLKEFHNSIHARSETIFSLLESEPTKTINSVMAGVLKARELVQALVELQRDEESTDFLRSLEDSQRRDLAFSSFRLTNRRNLFYSICLEPATTNVPQKLIPTKRSKTQTDCVAQLKSLKSHHLIIFDQTSLCL